MASRPACKSCHCDSIQRHTSICICIHLRTVQPGDGCFGDCSARLAIDLSRLPARRVMNHRPRQMTSHTADRARALNCIAKLEHVTGLHVAALPTKPLVAVRSIVSDTARAFPQFKISCCWPPFVLGQLLIAQRAKP